MKIQKVPRELLFKIRLSGKRGCYSTPLFKFSNHCWVFSICFLERRLNPWLGLEPTMFAFQQLIQLTKMKVWLTKELLFPLTSSLHFKTKHLKHIKCFKLK